ncbi:SDR family NAD(P)-dependent oxidoreductase [Arthrobacter sp. 2MCAF14]|uniref:SDR family NAD(P)-dependent oxidoreductase n=1 Tax=Arthrobacter sp. 2MCAF14 TaxID=3232982 RepID=UPI003F8DDE95
MTGHNGRIAVVTGGMSGLGEAFTARLRQDGITVYTIDLNPEADYSLDISDSSAVADAARQIGPVDILVNSAGKERSGPSVLETSDEDWDLMLRVNAAGTFYACRAFIPGMIDKGWGRVVNIASMAGKEGNPYNGAYSASKAAVIALTKSIAKELATTGVLVNAVAPGVFETPILKGADPDTLKAVTQKIPMNRMGRPEEAAELIAFLCSDRASFSTGFTYDLSGGRATY